MGRSSPEGSATPKGSDFSRVRWQGSGLNDYGILITYYVDDHPPDEFIHVKQGANYGWPFANPDPDTPNGLDNMPFAPNYEPGLERVPGKYVCAGR
jgi:hypothetical protein